MSSVAHFNHNLRTLCGTGQLKEALHILLNTQNPSVDSSTYLLLLQACITKKEKALSEGKQIHTHINERGFPFTASILLQNTIINMYDKCGSLFDARKVFDEIPQPNVFSWNMIIAAYRRHGLPQEALTLFHQMQVPKGYLRIGQSSPNPWPFGRTGVQPDQYTFSIVLPICANMASLEHGFQIHGRVIRCGFLSDIVVMNSVIDMYTKCGSIHKARELFDKMAQRNVVSWTAMITGYAQIGVVDEALTVFEEMPRRDLVAWTAMVLGYARNGLADKALEFFEKMQLAGVRPDSSAFATILSVCAKIGFLDQGMEIHQRIAECGFLSEVIVVTALADMYAKCGSIQKAEKLFEKMPQQNVVSCNTMIVGYAQNGLVDKALDIFKQMQLMGIKPNSSTFVSVLPACSKMEALKVGMEIHRNVVESQFLSDVVVMTALIDMYAKCGSMEKGRELFDKMDNPDGVAWNAMIAAYGQNGVLDEALILFNKMPQRDVISWTAIISGYAQNGHAEKALLMFEQMQLAGEKPNSSTFCGVLPACAKLGTLEQGQDIHQKIIKRGFSSDIIVMTALIDLYAKCGNIQKARELFDRLHYPGIISWNAMIAGYAMHGFSIFALKLFNQMKLLKINPDHVSFISVLFACSHAGLVEDGCQYFNQMSESHFITPTINHFVCMVDLLGRGGYLEEALNFIIKMQVKPNVDVWICLLGSCRSHKTTRLGEFVAKLLNEVDPKSTGPCVLLSNIYATVGSWGDVQKTRELIKDREIRKIPGCSWIEVHKMVHAFSVGDRAQPQTQEIYARLEKLS